MTLIRASIFRGRSITTGSHILHVKYKLPWIHIKYIWNMSPVKEREREACWFSPGAMIKDCYSLMCLWFENGSFSTWLFFLHTSSEIKNHCVKCFRKMPHIVGLLYRDMDRERPETTWTCSKTFCESILLRTEAEADKVLFSSAPLYAWHI